MSDHNDLPWDKRPVTARDATIAATLAVIGIGAIAAIFFILLRTQSAAGPDIQATAAPASPSGQPAGVDAEQVEAGQAIFQQSCVACHTIGGGTLVGPDLAGVTERRDRDWLRDWISRPDEMLAEGDPIATRLLEEFKNVPMPNSQLSQAEVADVLAFLESSAGEGIGPAQVSSMVPPEGDAARGQALFIGATPLQNGGPACLSCHGIAGIGLLGGGTLGPDLTNVHDRYGEAGLAGALEGLPFPSMRGVFADRPLTDVEVGHLYVYFVQANQTPAEPVNFNFVLIGLGGFLFLVLLSQLIWRKRLRAVRMLLVGR
jgi:mono/diheme cytochrome c family protein